MPDPATPKRQMDPERPLLGAIVGATVGIIVMMLVEGTFAWDQFLITYAVAVCMITLVWWLWVRFFRN